MGKKAGFKKLANKIIMHFVLVAMVPLALTTWITIKTISSLESQGIDPAFDQHLRVLKSFSVGSSLLTFVLVFAVAYYTAGFIVKRLYALKKAADEITGGNVDYRLDPNVEDELSEIYDSFNIMSGFIGDSQNSLNLTVEKLEKALLKEKELSELKSKFITVISHQLRTPLSAIRWNLELLEEESKMGKEEKGLIKDTHDSSVRLSGIIDDLLIVMEIEKQSLELKYENLDPVEIMQEVLKAQQESADQKQLKVSFKPAKSLHKIRYDHDKLKRILQGLIDNAIAYTWENGKITLDVKEEDNNMVFSVNDTGIGIPQKDHANIGTKFFRGSNATNMRADGSGIGLFLIRKLVEAGGGEFWFESNRGEGSSFYVSLPIDPDLNSQNKDED